MAQMFCQQGLRLYVAPLLTYAEFVAGWKITWTVAFLFFLIFPCL